MLIRSVTPFLLAAVVAASSAPAALAEDAAPGHGRGMFLEKIFERLDADGDGIVTRAEAERVGAEMFASLDSDGDGVVSEREFLEPKRSAEAAAHGNRWREHRARRFAAMDQDGDGAITPEEQADFGDRRFAMADANNDGRLTLEEVKALHRKRGQP
jgi:Ca2+-binding EF-hand superfamily protein